MTRHLQGVRAFLLPLVFAATAFAQVATTSLRGVIKDPSGAVIPGATVTLTNNSTGSSMPGTSNSAGEYSFNQIAPSKYTVKVSSAGFGDQAKSAELLVNQPATINFTMSVQASQQVVNVSAEAETVNTTDASMGNAFNNATIQALPSEGRNVPGLLALQPGVVYLGQDNDQTTDSRSGSVNGGRSDQGNVTLDGLDDNDQTQGFAFTGVLRETLDSVEEFRVTTSNSGVDSGRSSGAQISLVTKSGTNHFHGAAYEYNRPSFTVANDWFNKQAQIASGLPNVPGKLIRNTFGADVGGPIVKDKLFFFANYEGQRTAENTQVTQTDPTASFQAGNIVYQTAAGGNYTLTPSDIASMDTACTTYSTCPWGPGIDPNILKVFATQYPAANGTSAGDGGYNSGSYTFSSPSPATLNTSIVKLDYTPNDRNRFFVRGNLQKDLTDGPEQYPGLPANYVIDDNTKGIAAGWTWTLTPNLVNDLRYGYIRQGYSNLGTLNVDNVSFRFLSQPIGQNRSIIVHVPVNNIVDDVSWTKGKHTISGGANWRLIYNDRDSDETSFTTASTNEYWISGGGAIANTGNALDPAAFGFPAVNNNFTNSYNIAVALLVGIVPETNEQYNYNVNKGGLTGSQIPDGAFIDHEFKANEFESYLQDSWRVTPKLTVNYGLRYSLLQTPYEIHGQEVAPTTSTDAWFNERATNAARGVAYEPLLTFSPAGKANNGIPYWPSQKYNIAPRFSFAYEANSRTSIRGGFGMYYDHFGQGIVDSFDSYGSFGLTTSVDTPASTYSTESSPRYTGYTAIPPLPPGLNQPSSITYPYTPPVDGFGIQWGIDDKIKTPYSYAIDFSVQRDVGHGFIFETAYVGRLGRHLLQQLDLAEPVDLSDNKSGMDYYTAATMLSKDVDAGATTVAAIPYWEDLFPYLATGGMSATQNIYSNIWQYQRGNETTALALLDDYPSCLPANGGIGCGPQSFRYYQSQFSSLYSWASIGTSSYNAAQFILKRAFTHGLELNASYTFSRSIDLGSDAERMTEIGGTGFSEIINSFRPKLNKAVSDFDTPNIVTANWVYLLPVGRGQQFGSGMNRLAEGFLGGWQLSGIYRWTSGLPFTIIEPYWATNYQEESGMVQTGPIQTHKTIQPGGSPNAFASPGTLPLRLPYPGEAGQRNNFRGDGYFDIDSGLTKSWNIREGQDLKFDWEVYNVTNSVRFNDSPVTTLSGVTPFSNQYTSGSLGDYSATLSEPRKMQFGLRYDF